MRKLAGGWLGVERGFSQPGHDEVTRSQMWWFDEGLANGRLIHEWETEPAGMRYLEGKPLIFNPAPETAIQAYDERGTRAFVRYPAENRLHIIDGMTGQELGVVETTMKRVPFDEGWGRQKLTELRQRLAKRSALEVVGEFPQAYPAISSMSWLAEGCLRVSQAVGEDEDHQVLHFDRNGRGVEPVPSHGSARLIAIRGQHAYLADFDSDTETASLVCRPIAGMSADLAGTFTDRGE